MAEVAEDYDPKYEFLAPKYVNLLEAASEAALYDGADEWFDKLQLSTELPPELPVIKSQAFPEDENFSVDAKNPVEIHTRDFRNDSTEPQKGCDSTLQTTCNSDKENDDIEPSATRILEENHKNQVTNEPQEKQKTSTAKNTIEYSSNQLLGSESWKSSPKQKNYFSDTKQRTKPRQSILTEQSSNGKRIQKVNEYFDNKTCSETTAKKEQSKNAGLSQQIEESKQNAFHAKGKTSFTVPPALQTEQRAFLHKERRKSSTDTNPKVNEPRTPKNFGESWKPCITIPRSPKFHSERRLRHCVERTLQQRSNTKIEPAKVPRRVSSLTLTVPESPTFYTQKRAETYRALKGVPLTYEEEELQRIQAERDALRKLIQSGRQVYAKTINFKESKATNESKPRVATIPRKFTFATEERSIQRSNNSFKETNSNLSQQVSSHSKKSMDSKDSSVAQTRQTLKVPSRSSIAQRTTDRIQNSTKTGSLTKGAEGQRREDSSRTSKSQVGSIPSKTKNSSIKAQKVDVFTRLYQYGKRRTQEASPNTNKSLATYKSTARRPVILNTRLLPKLREVSNVNEEKSKRFGDRRLEESSTVRPQYAFRTNSPVHNKAKRASRVPINENEQAVGMPVN